MFNNEVLLISGGTGSFGNEVLKLFLKSEVKEIRIFSRDEEKQYHMRKKYNDDRLSFYIGDIRDINSVRSALKGVDYVFHASALKQVPSCEFFPMEAVKTNIIGTDNILDASIEEGVKKVICLSTDKAVYPINAMGISKAMMEKVFVAKSRITDKTVICGTRYGNVMCSRGSVIPLFIEQIKNGEDITITNPDMTRFMMSLEEAVGLVVYAFNNANPGDIMVQKAPSCTILTLAKALKEIFNSDSEIRVIGVRHGEKIHETLLTTEECLHAEDLGDFYRIPADNRDLNYSKYFDKGNSKEPVLKEFTSNSTRILNVDEMKEKLLKLDYVKNALLG